MGSRGPAPQPWRRYSRHGTRRGHRTHIYIGGTYCAECVQIFEGEVRCPNGEGHRVRWFDLNDPGAVDDVIERAREDRRRERRR